MENRRAFERKPDRSEALRTGSIDLLDHLEMSCDLIEKKERLIHAFVPGTYSRSNVISKGRRLLEKYPDPRKRPPLFAFTLGVKDIIRVNGLPTRCGSGLHEGFFDGAEAEVVTRLLEAGAIVMGKTVTTEFAYFKPGPTRNPFNPSHTPGGSSSGSAAGLSAGFFSLSLGTQTIGSIIRPAAYCGVTGYKPSYGRISQKGVFPVSKSLDHVGFFCTDASILSLVAGVLLRDWSPSHLDASSGDMKILGIPHRAYLSQASERENALFNSRIESLKNYGYRIEKCDILSDIEEINALHRKIMAAEAARAHEVLYSRYGELYSSATRELIDTGQKVTDSELGELLERLLRERRRLRKEVDELGVDFLVSPPATDQAPKGLETTGDPVMNLPWTFAGLPVVSLPTVLDRDGMPHGIQITGGFQKDEELISFAEMLSDTF